MSRFVLRDLTWLTLVLALAGGAGGQQPDAWKYTLKYGGGTPLDAGPLGHCTATFASDGKVRIESKGRFGVPGPHDVVVYETESLDSRKLAAIHSAIKAALNEKPFTRRGENADGKFLRLKKDGSPVGLVEVSHNQLLGYYQTPPEMQRLAALINELLPEKERIPLKDPTSNKPTSERP